MTKPKKDKDVLFVYHNGDEAEKNYNQLVIEERYYSYDDKEGLKVVYDVLGYDVNGKERVKVPLAGFMTKEGALEFIESHLKKIYEGEKEE